MKEFVERTFGGANKTKTKHSKKVKKTKGANNELRLKVKTP
jgi:hypothetical protein